MKLFYLVVCFATFTFSVIINTVPSGVVENEDGVIINSFSYHTHVLNIEFPKFVDIFVKILDKLDLPADMKEAVHHHLIGIGQRLDTHLETSLISFMQEFDHQSIDMKDITYFWNKNATFPHDRMKRAVPVVIGAVVAGGLVIAGVGAVLGAVNTAQISRMNDIIERQTHAMATLDKSLSTQMKALQEVAEVANLVSKDIKVLFGEVNKLELRLQHGIMITFLISEIDISSSIQIGEITDELEHLRLGRFPMKLLSPSVMKKFLDLTSGKDGMVFPLRQLATSVLGLDVKGHKIRLLVNVPVMSDVIYYKRLKVRNIGYQDGDCRIFIHTPKYLAYVSGKLVPINDKYCTYATPAAIKCDETALLFASECWPANSRCGVTSRCPEAAKERIIATETGYLVTMKENITVRKNGKIIKVLHDNSQNYLINAKPTESVMVDDTEINLLKNGLTSTYDEWDFKEDNTTTWSTNFSTIISEIEAKQKDMNVEMRKLNELEHPFFAGLDHNTAFNVLIWSIFGMLCFILVTLMGLCCRKIYQWKSSTPRSTNATGQPTQVQIFTPAAPISPSAPSAPKSRFEY